MNTDKNVATVRTTVNAGIASVLIWVVVNIFGWSVDLNDPVVILIVTAVAGFFYRLSVVLTETFPWLGYLLFGIPKRPSYVGTTDDPPADDGAVDLETVLVVFAIAVLVVAVYHAVFVH